jgi:hypothetical protein
MHGTELCVPECCALLPLCSPSGVFRHQAQCFLARRSLSPQQDRSLATAFRSPGTASAFAASIPGSTFLACHFATRTVAHKLVRPSAPLPVAVRPASGRFLASARRLLASAPDQPLLRPPLPFGACTPLQIKAFCRFRCRSVRLPITPDFLSLPASVFLSLVGGSGSMFQVRYVFGGLLFLKPLGTFLTMRPG